MTLAQTLLAFSRKEASAEAVMRALCEYDGWYAPMELALAAFKTNVFEHASLWGAQSQVAPGKLYFFTDRAAGEAALRKVQLGGYVSPLSGATLFANLPSGFSELRVNPANPQEEGWFIAGDAFDLARLWGQAIALEQVFAKKRESANIVDQLIDFPGYTIFTFPNGSVAYAMGIEGYQNPAMVFTAPDCAALAQEKLGAQAAALKRVTVSGEALFAAFPRLAVDGMVFNPFGPGTAKMFDAKLCQSLCGSVAARAEVKRLEALAKET